MIVVFDVTRRRLKYNYMWFFHRKNILTYLFLFIFFQNHLWAKTDRYRCMWREDPATTMTIGWEQVSGNNPVIYYDEIDGGQNPNSYYFSQKVDRQILAKGMNNQFVRLTSLKPNTIYYFIIKDNEGVSRQMSFKTAPDNPYERLSIIAGGDSRNHRKARRNANLLVSKLRPHAVMFGGDMTGGDVAKQWKAWFDDWQNTITSDGHLTPIIVARGNHESSNKSLVDLFDVKNEKIVYALNMGGSLLRIYTLNSMIATGGNQKAWLKDDLSQHGYIKWKMAQYHHATRPHNSKKSERNGQLKNWSNLFYEHGVDLVCESDSHVAKATFPIRPSRERGSEEGFIRDDERGTVYVGEGCWGAPLRRNNDDKIWTRASGSFNQFKWIFVDLDGIEIRTIKVDNAAQVGSVSEYDIFSEPSGLDVWSPMGGRVIHIGSKRVVANNTIPSTISNPPVAEMPSTKTSEPTRDYRPSKSSTSVQEEKPTVVIPRKKKEPSRSTKLLNVKPLEIYEMEAQLEGGEVVVQWRTKNEYLQPTYEIQRSLDGRKYTTFARMQGNGNYSKKQENRYKIIDKIRDLAIEVLPKYRLRHVQKNGEVMLVQAKVKINESLKWNKFDKLKTNPKTGQIQFRYQLKQPGNVNVKLLNALRQEVFENEFKNVSTGNFLRTIDVKGIEEGDYLLIIEANQEIIQQYKVEKRI